MRIERIALLEPRTTGIALVEYERPIPPGGLQLRRAVFLESGDGIPGLIVPPRQAIPLDLHVVRLHFE